MHLTFGVLLNKKSIEIRVTAKLIGTTDLRGAKGHLCL
jgi:hypothetical protein